MCITVQVRVGNNKLVGENEDENENEERDEERDKESKGKGGKKTRASRSITWQEGSSTQYNESDSGKGRRGRDRGSPKQDHKVG